MSLDPAKRARVADLQAEVLERIARGEEGVVFRMAEGPEDYLWEGLEIPAEHRNRQRGWNLAMRTRIPAGGTVAVELVRQKALARVQDPTTGDWSHPFVLQKYA
jgi:hypothetical protein